MRGGRNASSTISRSIKCIGAMIYLSSTAPSTDLEKPKLFSFSLSFIYIEANNFFPQSKLDDLDHSCALLVVSLLFLSSSSLLFFSSSTAHLSHPHCNFDWFNQKFFFQRCLYHIHSEEPESRWSGLFWIQSVGFAHYFCQTRLSIFAQLLQLLGEDTSCFRQAPSIKQYCSAI